MALDALLLHTPAGEAAQAAPEPEEAPADEDAEIFAAARAWDAAEEAEQKEKKAGDVIFINNISMTRSDFLIGKLAKVIK